MSAAALPPELTRLLQAEPERFGALQVDGEVLSGLLGHEHPMAWRRLAGLDAVEALTLVAPSAAELDALPDWRDPGWAVSTEALAWGDSITLWWHARTRQAMLASQIPLEELRPDAVARTLQGHGEGLALCRRRVRLAEAEAPPPDAVARQTLAPGWRIA